MDQWAGEVGTRSWGSQGQWAGEEGHLTQLAEWLQDIPLQGHLKLSQDAGQLVLNGTAHLQGLPADKAPGGQAPKALPPIWEHLMGLSLPTASSLCCLSFIFAEPNTIPGLAALTDLDTVPSLATLPLRMPSLTWPFPAQIPPQQVRAEALSMLTLCWNRGPTP